MTESKPVMVESAGDRTPGGHIVCLDCRRCGAKNSARFMRLHHASRKPRYECRSCKKTFTDLAQPPSTIPAPPPSKEPKKFRMSRTLRDMQRAMRKERKEDSQQVKDFRLDYQDDRQKFIERWHKMRRGERADYQKELLTIKEIMEAERGTTGDISDAPTEECLRLVRVMLDDFAMKRTQATIVR